MKRVLREPLAHFLLLGACLFLVSSLMGAPAPGGPAGSEPARIVVTGGHVDRLRVGFAMTWHRPPTPQELDALVEEHVREEVYYREALAMGLDRDDTIVRRRMKQKMEFLAEDVALPAAPTDAELAAFMEAHPDAFRAEPRVAFRHVYVNRDRRGRTAEEDAAEMLRQLRAERADADTLGDMFLLPYEFPLTTGADVGKLFGAAFAARLLEASPGRWEGPVESGYGLHLVRVERREDGRVPPLGDVRDAVRREWLIARVKASKEAAYQRLRQRYTVVVEPPRGASHPAPAGPAKVAETR